MKIFLYFFWILCVMQVQNANAMFGKTNMQLVGRPKFAKPMVGTIYAGAGVGVPMYGITNIAGADYGSPASNTAVQNSVQNGTAIIPITLPMVNAYVGYLQLSMPLRHEFGFTFLSNNFGVDNDSIIINNNTYTNSKASIQNYFLTYALYYYYPLRRYPMSLFIGGGGGLAIFKSSFSDGGTLVTNPTTSVVTTTVQPSINTLTTGGVINISTGLTYRIIDDMAIQVKISYYLVSSPFNVSGSSFPFMHVVSFNLDMFFKVI